MSSDNDFGSSCLGILFILYCIISQIMTAIFFIGYCKVDNSLLSILFIDPILAEIKGWLWIFFLF